MPNVMIYVPDRVYRELVISARKEGVNEKFLIRKILGDWYAKRKKKKI